MTTTAFDDQFTDAPESVRQPYDTGSILRRNVADLEIALRKQTERAEKAEAELERLREQKPIKYLYRVTDCFGHDVLRDDPKGATILETIPLYAAPVPAPAVPAEFFTWVAAYGDYIEKLDVYNKKLTISKTLPFPGLDMNDEFQAFSAAQRKAHRMLPDLFEKARALLQSRAVKDFLTSQADCRACVNRGKVNGPSQESFCDSCIWQGMSWRKDHHAPAVPDADSVARFEAWVLAQADARPNLKRGRGTLCNKYPDGSYHTLWVDMAWEGWKARALLQSAEVAK